MNRFFTAMCCSALLVVPVVVQAVTITPTNLQGWAPANVRNSGTVAITTAYPNATNGSLRFVQSTGADKADFEIVNSNVGGFGLVKDITSVGYEFYRASGTVPAWLAPVLRLGVYDPVSGKASLLIWEPVYNGSPLSVPVGNWVAVDASTGNWWMRALGGSACTYEVYYGITLAEWVSGLNDGVPIGQVLGCTPNPVGTQAWVASINVGIGSGWTGAFDGAVDNVQLGFGGTPPSMYNFEVDPAVSTQGRSWGTLKIRYR
jgi:hypothetical protein